MSLARYPTLLALQEDLTRLSATEAALVADGLNPVAYPGLNTMLLTAPQLAVVSELMAALVGSRTPEVDQGHLLRASGSDAVRLREVFAGSRAWGTLVVPGRRAGCYRLAAPLSDAR